jgi:hypothetical protein
VFAGALFLKQRYGKDSPSSSMGDHGHIDYNTHRSTSEKRIPV